MGMSIGTSLLSSFSFVLDKVCEVFHDCLMYVFHELFDFLCGILRFTSASSGCL